MKYIQSGLLTLLISLFILGACKNTDEIGLDVSPESQITGKLVDTATVLTTTVKEDTLLGNQLIQQPIGLSDDPVFGKTEAATAMVLSLPKDSTKVDFGNSPLLDSAVLVLPYGDEFYGDSLSSSYTVNIHQLNEKYNSSINYYNNKQWDYNITPIGNKTVNKFKLKDSVSITEIIKGKSDVSKKVRPQLRILVNNSFINSNFFAQITPSALNSNFSSNTKFQNFIKGLYIRVTKTGAGGVTFILPDSSKLELYYKRQVGTAIDTNVLKFPITASASYTHHNYSGTPIETQLNNPLQQYQSVYVQPLGGVRTRIRFPYIKNLKLLGNIVVNKAELVIYTDQTTGTLFTPAPRLTLYRTDIAGQSQEVPDNDIGQINRFGDIRALDVNSFGGFFDTDKKRYVFNISSYIQDILSGRLEQYNTYIAVIKSNLQRTVLSNPRLTDLYPSGITAAQSVLLSGANNDTNYKMKLNIYYTIQGK